MSRCLALTLGSLLLAAPATGLADRVVVGPIRGDTRQAIGRRVEAILSERLDVIPWSEFRDGYEGTGAQAVRTACEHVRARRVILGDVNSRRSVRLIAMSCETGEVDIEQEVQLLGGSPERSALNDAMVNLVPEAGSPEVRAVTRRGSGSSIVDAVVAPRAGGRRAAPAPEPEPEPQAEEEEPVFDANSIAGGESEELPGEETVETETPGESAFIASASFGDRGSDATVGGSSSLDDENPAVSSSSDVTPSGPELASYLEASLGAAFATRSLVIPIANAEASTVGYSGGGYAEIGLQANFFPLGPFVRQGWARMVGLQASFNKGVGMPVSQGTNLSTDAVDGSFGLLGRYGFGQNIGFELRPSVAYGWKGFAISPNPDVATFNYRFIRLGFEGRVLLLDKKLALGVSGAYRMVTAMGEAQTAYGNQAQAMGWDIGGFAALRIGKLFEISAGAELVSFSGAFLGTGTLPGRPGITSTDQYPRAYLRAGVVLR